MPVCKPRRKPTARAPRISGAPPAKNSRPSPRRAMLRPAQCGTRGRHLFEGQGRQCIAPSCAAASRVDAAALEKALASTHLAAVHALTVVGRRVRGECEGGGRDSGPGRRRSALAHLRMPAAGAGGAAPPPRPPGSTSPRSTPAAASSARRGRIPVPGIAQRAPVRSRRSGGHRHGKPGRAHGHGIHRHHSAARHARRHRHGARRPRCPPCSPATPPLSQEAERKLRAQDTAAAQSETPLARRRRRARALWTMPSAAAPAVLARGDDAGQSAAALDLLAGRFPNLWEQGKQYLSLEEIRYDLHRFFSLRSGVGQAAAGSVPPGSLDEAASAAGGARM